MTVVDKHMDRRGMRAVPQACLEQAAREHFSDGGTFAQIDTRKQGDRVSHRIEALNPHHPHKE